MWCRLAPTDLNCGSFVNDPYKRRSHFPSFVGAIHESPANFNRAKRTFHLHSQLSTLHAIKNAPQSFLRCVFVFYGLAVAVGSALTSAVGAGVAVGFGVGVGVGVGSGVGSAISNSGILNWR